MTTLNTTLLAAASILAATLSTSALAADKAEQRTSATGNATTSQAAPADATREKTRAEFLRARQAGELEYGHEFQIAETSAFKRAKPEAAVQVAAH